MAQVAPNLYRKYITVDRKNTPIWYVKNAESTIWVAKECSPVLLKARQQFRENSFALNPYDPCVANKVING